MGNSETSPTSTENVSAHFTDWAVILDNVGWLHDEIPAHYFGIEFNGLLQARHGNADMREVSWVNVVHSLSSCVKKDYKGRMIM